MSEFVISEFFSQIICPCGAATKPFPYNQMVLYVSAKALRYVMNHEYTVKLTYEVSGCQMGTLIMRFLCFLAILA